MSASLKEIDAEIDRLSELYSQEHEDAPLTDAQLDRFWDLYDQDRGMALDYMRQCLTSLPLPNQTPTRTPKTRLCTTPGCDQPQVPSKTITMCRECSRDYSRRYTAANREKCRAAQRRYAEKRKMERAS